MTCLFFNVLKSFYLVWTVLLLQNLASPVQLGLRVM